MKKQNIFILLIFGIFFSCEDYLEKHPNFEASAEGYFINEKAAQESRIGLYSTFSSLFTDNRYQLDATVDQLHAQYNWGAAASINRGIVAPETGGVIYSLYAGGFWAIAAANDHIANINRMADDLFSDLTKEHYLADARFIKAFNYFYLTEAYGGVPLYREKIETIEGHKIKQSPKSEIVEYILGELDLAIEALPTQSYNGYINKGAALALKAKIHLANGQWQQAADVAEMVINSGVFGLDPDYFNLFIKEGQAGSKEIIFASEYQFPERAHSLTRTLVHSSGGTPRQEFVDSYLMSDGLPVGVSPLDASNYQNRDPRFELSIYPEDHDWYDASGNLVQYEPTQTGWYIKKYFDRNLTDENSIHIGGTSEQSMIHLRYADVLLMFAEAKHKLGQFNQEVYDQTIKLIRDRVGMGNVDVSGMSDTDKMDLIMYERNVELAFEGQRRFDLLRWGILGETIQSLTDPVNITITWKNHFSLWPFVFSELNLNPNLDQNDGYTDNR